MGIHLEFSHASAASNAASSSSGIQIDQVKPLEGAELVGSYVRIHIDEPQWLAASTNGRVGKIWDYDEATWQGCPYSVRLGFDEYGSGVTLKRHQFTVITQQEAELEDLRRRVERLEEQMHDLRRAFR